MINRKKTTELEEWKRIANGAMSALRGELDNWELEQLFEAYYYMRDKEEKKNK